MKLPPPDVERELLDVVNADDRVIVQASRGMIHRARLWHRAVHVLVFNPAGELFLQRRAWWKECAPGLWDTSAAGHLAAGERYRNAAGRELEEELGIPATADLTPLFKLPATPATGFEFVEVFAVVFAERVTPDPAEIMDSRWCAVDTLERWLAAAPANFTGSFRLIWERWRATTRSTNSVTGFML